ncbi:hypothetical protein F1880_008449 [Penicillium rolfsii]|nr:hypothetical protein F1880_008449 [Penicillium rolfsii]
MLLLKILTSALGIAPIVDLSVDCLATLLAKIFHEAYPIKDLEAAFQKVPEILRSKPDRIVATEMFHVKAFEQACQINNLDDRSHIFVFHVLLETDT